MLQEWADVGLLPNSLPQDPDAEIISFGPNFLVGLSRFNPTAEIVDEEIGQDWLKFHFQLRGTISYTVPGQSPLAVDDLTCVAALHGQGIVKKSFVAPRPGFAVTVLCRPEMLRERFGVHPSNMPSPLSRYLEQGEPTWYAETGKMTPEMVMSVRALEAMSFKGAMRNAYVEARGVELLCEFWSQISRGGTPPNPAVDERTLSKVERARDHIDTYFREPLAMQKLARHVGTNETKLSQAFRTVFGMTIFEYIRARRMEEGQRLLRAGKLSVTEIAFEVGYDYSCNFSVAYKRHFGITPKEERATARR
ncbi:helix-turn-helix transcriptional regulator [Nitrospirillum amazonense]|uniref:helix-turn-helix transcriptional regulator n=2 Tax=Nitrospirillum TaxID=1543705 RepID=UPI0024121DDF|nr:AraC family transcriptional regulator [Nitrospirillum amazonense]MDG3439257.1 AraC family transcriptional regulator [Nitrospirillum amazonense]